MNYNETTKALTLVGNAKRQWAMAQTKFTRDLDMVMRRLLHEAAANRMSPEQVADLTGLTPKRVRELMRRNGLNPKTGKILLAKTAAATLQSNAEILGIEPKDIDLASPLAYLPAGPALLGNTVSQVKDLDEDE